MTLEMPPAGDLLAPSASERRCLCWSRGNNVHGGVGYSRGMDLHLFEFDLNPEKKKGPHPRNPGIGLRTWTRLSQ
eukprot:4549772-Prorocentrum_lima.AAC.1